MNLLNVGYYHAKPTDRIDLRNGFPSRHFAAWGGYVHGGEHLSE